MHRRLIPDCKQGLCVMPLDTKLRYLQPHWKRPHLQDLQMQPAPDTQQQLYLRLQARLQRGHSPYRLLREQLIVDPMKINIVKCFIKYSFSVNYQSYIEPLKCEGSNHLLPLSFPPEEPVKMIQLSGRDCFCPFRMGILQVGKVT